MRFEKGLSVGSNKRGSHAAAFTDARGSSEHITADRISSPIKTTTRLACGHLGSAFGGPKGTVP
jgi:hypothetical protein